MSGYLSSRKLTNVTGRISYITDEDRQENVVDYYNTTDNEFWSMLAKENRERFKEVKTKGKCCEARELIIGIPQDSNITAKELCDIFKGKYDVECACSIHQNNKEGIINRHCHLVFSERKRLNEPEVIGEKKAVRTYYYDEKGKKCKKTEAVKVVKKGTVLQKGRTRYFSDKNEFFKTQEFVYECKELFLEETLKINWSFEVEHLNKGLSEKHIGKNNPKEEYIKRNNELKALVKDVCKANDFVLQSEIGTSLKNLKQNYDIKSFSALNYEDNKDKVDTFVKESQKEYKDIVRQEVNLYNNINTDKERLIEYQSSSKQFSFIERLQQIIVDKYKNQSNISDKFKLNDWLKEKLANMLDRIVKLVSVQNLLHIVPKNQIEVEQSKTTNALHIKNDDYIKRRNKSRTH